ncbi:DUF4129 domain-containing protein [Georgenia wangjunii]|uniref:DUF4129 domain-containing protein n=1 Tax=Georgenia wangjunii TaxID=3117730 RepID=UPI002F2600AE
MSTGVARALAAGPLALPAGVPVTPDAEEARRWAADELARSVYDTDPGLLARAWEWFVTQLDRLLRLEASTPPNLVPLVVVIGVAVLLGLALYLGGPVRRRRRAPATSFAVFDDERSSTDLTAAADRAAGEGDWALAVLMRFRAIVRSLDERTVLEDRPGLTAHEASTLAAARLPGVAGGLTAAGRLFDDVCYGSARPGPEEDAELRTLARAVAAARPERATAGAPSMWAPLG